MKADIYLPTGHWIAESVDVVELPAVNQALLDIAWAKVWLDCKSAEQTLDQQLHDGAIPPEPHAQAKEAVWGCFEIPEEARLGERKAVSVRGLPGWKLWHVGIRVKALNMFNAVNAAGGYKAVRIRSAFCHDNQDMLFTGSIRIQLETDNCKKSC
jgi:hypothetical protein